MRILVFILILISSTFAGEISFSNKDFSQIYQVICDSVICYLEDDTLINISDYVFIISEAENYDFPIFNQRYSPKQDTAAFDIDLFCTSFRSILDNKVYKKISCKERKQYGNRVEFGASPLIFYEFYGQMYAKTYFEFTAISRNGVGGSGWMFILKRKNHNWIIDNIHQLVSIN